MNIAERGPSVRILILLGALLWGGEYFLRGLWEPDEARYAYVAREMQQGGHWFVPHLHGEPYPDKPPLPFWLANLCAAPVGGDINGVTARLPTFFAAMLVLWVTARLLERWRDPAAAWRGVWVLFTVYMFWHEGGRGRIDMLLCALVMTAVYLFFTYNDTGQTWRALLAHVLVGLAVFAKGPIGIALPLGIYVAGTWATGGPRLLRRWHWAWGIPLAIAIPVAWLLIAWLQGAPAEYFQAMFWSKSFGRVISDHHDQPFYYYLTTFPVDLLPWTIFLPSAIAGMGRCPERRRLMAWLIFVGVLFSLFAGKRNVYLLPLMPAAAMVIALGWSGLPALPRKWSAIPAWIAIGVVTLVGLGHVVAMWLPQLPVAAWRLLPGAIITLSGAVLLIREFRRVALGGRWLHYFCGTFFLLWIASSTLVLPAFDPVKTPEAVVSEARERLKAVQYVYVYRDQLAIIPLYADRPGRYLREPADVAAVLDRGSPGVIAFSERNWEELEPLFGPRVRARPFRMGAKRLVWVEFPVADASTGAGGR